MKIQTLVASLALLPLGLACSTNLFAQASISTREDGDAIVKQTLTTEPQNVDPTVATGNRRLAATYTAGGTAGAAHTTYSGNDGSPAEVIAVDGRTGTAIVKSKDGSAIRLQQIVARAGGGNKSQAQVIAFSPMDSGKRAEMIEDLNVMTKLVDNAVSEQSDPDATRAMGINVTTILADGGPLRSIYVEGHGAIFHAAVKFPLKATEKSDTVAPPKATKNTPWEEARKDLYGGRQAESIEWASRADNQGEEYNEERVESLKSNVIKALGNANNFRHLNQAETITAVIRSTSGGSRRVSVGRLGNTGGVGSFGGSGGFSGSGFGSSGSGSPYSTGALWGEPRAAANEETMTIRVKKSDADSLANGKITEEDFRKRATVAVY